jgi:hypothetical protein
VLRLGVRLTEDREDVLRLGVRLTEDREDVLRLGVRLTEDREDMLRLGVRLPEDREDVLRLGVRLTEDREDMLRLGVRLPEDRELERGGVTAEDEYFLVVFTDRLEADRLELDVYSFVVATPLVLPDDREEELELRFFTAAAGIREPDLDETVRLVPGS